MEVQLVLFLITLLCNVSIHVSEETCGRPLGSVTDGKIVGGYDIGYVKYPWFVSLIKDGDPYCGGTLITPRHVVTAAHCFKSSLNASSAGILKLENVFTLRFGVYNICTTEETQKNFKVAKVYVHEKYKKRDPYFDIALMKLKKEATGFEPCCLPDKALTSATRPLDAYIQGLGDLVYEAKTQTCTMHEARVLVYPDTTCRKMLDKEEDDGASMVHAFCAGYLKGGIDSCQGDSGGPLIYLGNNSQYYLLGITSFGFDCAKEGVLGVYTDATHFLPWIRQKIGKPPPSTTTTTSGSTQTATTQSSVSTKQDTTTTTQPTTSPTSTQEETTSTATTPTTESGEVITIHHHHHHHEPIIIIITKNKEKKEKKEKRHRKLKHRHGHEGKRKEKHQERNSRRDQERKTHVRGHS